MRDGNDNRCNAKNDLEKFSQSATKKKKEKTPIITIIIRIISQYWEEDLFWCCKVFPSIVSDLRNLSKWP